MTLKASDLLPDRTAYALAADADCAGPDSLESAGAKFLESVFDGVREALDYRLADGLTVAEIVRDMDYTGAIHEIADGAPNVYTHTRWAEFVDLAAYSEDLDEVGGMPESDGQPDMTAAAGVALYMIAERLVRALLAEAEEKAEKLEEVSE